MYTFNNSKQYKKIQRLSESCAKHSHQKKRTIRLEIQEQVRTPDYNEESQIEDIGL